MVNVGYSFFCSQKEKMYCAAKGCMEKFFNFVTEIDINRY